MEDGTLSKVIDKIFSIKRTTFLLGIVFAFGFILRTLSALRRKFNADEMVHGTHAIGFINSGKLQIMDQSSIWFWLTDFFMKVFGTNVFGIRFMSIFFGSLSILAVYLIGKEMFNKRVGLIAALISAISSYQINMMEAGMDTSMTFFVLLSTFFFMLSLKRKNKTYFYLIWISIGIAVMTKPIAIIFLISLLICSFYYHFLKMKSIKLINYFYAGLLLLIISMPVLTFNYLLYKDKGIVDLQVARFTKISFSTYESIAPTIQGFNPNSLFVRVGNFKQPTLIISASFLYIYEPIPMLILAVIGLFYLFLSKNKFSLLLITTFLIPFIFLAGTSVLGNHFIFTSYYAVLLAAFGIDKSTKLIKEEKHRKYIIYFIIIIIIIFSYYKIQNSWSNGWFGGKNEIGQVIDFKENNIKDSSIVVTDARIYTGSVAFMFWDKNYIGAIDFINLINNADQIPGEVLPMDIYFLECVPEDCGWGGGKISQELNQTMEVITSEFRNKGAMVKAIAGINGEGSFRIYKINMPVKIEMINIAKSTHVWFYYPVNYKPHEQIFDNYETHNFTDRSLDMAAHLILYIEILTAIMLTFAVFYFLTRDKENEEKV